MQEHFYTKFSTFIYHICLTYVFTSQFNVSHSINLIFGEVAQRQGSHYCASLYAPLNPGQKRWGMSRVPCCSAAHLQYGQPNYPSVPPEFVVIKVSNVWPPLILVQFVAHRLNGLTAVILDRTVVVWSVVRSIIGSFLYVGVYRVWCRPVVEC